METSSQSNIIRLDTENMENSDVSKIPITINKRKKRKPKKKCSMKKKNISKKKKDIKIIKINTKKNKRGVKIGNIKFSVDDEFVDYCFKNFK